MAGPHASKDGSCLSCQVQQPQTPFESVLEFDSPPQNPQQLSPFALLAAVMQGPAPCISSDLHDTGGRPPQHQDLDRALSPDFMKALPKPGACCLCQKGVRPCKKSRGLQYWIKICSFTRLAVLWSRLPCLQCTACCIADPPQLKPRLSMTKCNAESVTWGKLHRCVDENFMFHGDRCSRELLFIPGYLCLAGSYSRLGLCLCCQHVLLELSCTLPFARHLQAQNLFHDPKHSRSVSTPLLAHAGLKVKTTRLLPVQ